MTNDCSGRHRHRFSDRLRERVGRRDPDRTPHGARSGSGPRPRRRRGVDHRPPPWTHERTCRLPGRSDLAVQPDRADPGSPFISRRDERWTVRRLPSTTTDSSAVGQWGSAEGTSPPMARVGCPSGRGRSGVDLETSAGLALDRSGKRILRVECAEGVKNLMGGRLGFFRSNVGRASQGPVQARRSLWESARPGEDMIRSVPGRRRQRAGRRQGPYSKGEGGAARPKQRLPSAVIDSEGQHNSVGGHPG